MAIRLHCDRCGRFVNQIGEPRDLAVFKKECICKHCEKLEEKLGKMADGLKSSWAEKINQIIEEAKKEVREEVSKIKTSYGKED